MAERILVSRGTPPVKLATGKSHKIAAQPGEAYQVVDLSAPAGTPPEDPAKFFSQDGNLLVQYPDGTELSLTGFYTACADGACTLGLADGTAAGRLIQAGAVAAAGEGLGFWGWTGIIAGGGALAAAAGGGGGGGSAAVTNAAPLLTGKIPTHSGTDVTLATNISLQFNEAVLAGTGQIVITNNAGDTRAISVTDPSQVTISGNTVTINPTTDLQPNSTYTVQMAAGVLKDSGDVVFAGISAGNYAFQTIDTTAPALLSRLPLDNATGVLVDSNLSLTFSKNVRPGSGNIVISDGSGDTRTISISDTSQVTFNGATVTINPANDLTGNSHYSVQISSGAIEDSRGNPFSGINTATAFDFHTQDLAPPLLVTSNPSDNAVDVLESGSIILTFNESVQAGTGNFVISNGSDTRIISVADSQILVSGNTVTISLAAALQGGSHYAVTISSGALKDLAGNVFAGIADSTVLDFQTRDASGPLLLGSTPPDNTTGVLVGSNVVLTFNEAVQAGAGNIIISNGSDTRAISVTDTQVIFSGNTVTINPTTNLQSNSRYSVQMASGVIRDGAGNPYAGISSTTVLDFETQDLQAPTLVGSTPADNSTVVLVGDSIELRFSETVQAGTGNIVISDGTDVRTISISDTTQVTISGNTVTIDPAADLNAGSRYSVQIANGVIRDIQGNAFSGLTTSTMLDFSVVASGGGDTTAPTLQGSTPADNATGVSVGSDIVLVFSEDVQSGAGNIVVSNGVDTRTISVTDSSQVSVSGNVVTINPTVDLVGGSAYYVQISTGAIRDAAGNSYAGIADTTTLNLQTVVPAVELSAVAAGVGGFVINGQSAGDNSGYSVSSVGDVNGDGLADLIVGAYGSDPSGGASAGRSYVVFGKTENFAVDLSSVAAGLGGFVINGQVAGDFSGASVSSAGDVNGDGLVDLIVGAPGGDALSGSQAGRSYVVFGKTGTLAVELSAIASGNGGYVINGQSAGDGSGSSVSAAGDINGDGLADQIIGAPSAEAIGGESAGRTYVVFGKTDVDSVDLSLVSQGIGGFQIDGNSAWASSGASVSAAGDVNGDGFADLIVGTMDSPDAGLRPGRAYVVLGRQDATTVDLSEVALGNGGFLVFGPDGDGSAGYTVSQAGDVNGDGLSDVIIGSTEADPGTGAGRVGGSYVVFGKTDTTAVNLQSLKEDGTGFLVYGLAALKNAGWSSQQAGDINGDGLSDLIVGAYLEGTVAGFEVGRSYVVYGKTDSGDVSLGDTFNGVGGFAINGQGASDRSGYSVSSAGDVNGDGLADMVIGAYAGDSIGSTDAGRTYVIFGNTSGAFVQTSVDQYGATDADTFADSGTAQTLVTGLGDDTLTATAASILYGGAGHDMFNINAAMITALQSPFGTGGNIDRLSRIDGGAGIDIISLSGAGLTFDLTQVANQAASNPDGGSRIDDVEYFDLAGTGNNTLKLNHFDVLDLRNASIVEENGRVQLIVRGNAGDSVDFADGTGTTGWTQAGSIGIGVSEQYNIWNHTGTLATVYVQQTLTVI